MAQSVQPAQALAPSPASGSKLLFLASETLAGSKELLQLVSSINAAGWKGNLVLTDQTEDLTCSIRSALNEFSGDFVVPLELRQSDELPHLIPYLRNALADFQRRPSVDSNQKQIEHWFVTCIEHQPGLFLRFVSWLYHVFLRLLFGSHQSSFRTGFAIIPGDSALIKPEASHESIDRSATSKQPIRRISELIKICRLKNLVIRESVHGMSRMNSFENLSQKKEPTTSEPDTSKSKWWRAPFRLLQSLQPWALESALDLRFWWNRIAFPGPQSKSLKSAELNPTAWTRHRAIAAFVLLIVSCFMLFNNLNFPLFEPDETRNSQIALNVIDSGNWISLTLNDEPYWNKPPALIWAIALSYKTFGFSPWATRLPGAIASLLTIIAVLELGKKLVGFRAAFMGATAILLSCGFALISRWVIMDASFTFFVTVSSLALILANRSQWRRQVACEEPPLEISGKQKRWLILAGFCGGAATMLKGPVALVLVVPPALLAYAFAGELAFLRKRMAYFFVPFLLAAVPWYLTISIAQPGFIENYFWKQNLVRFSDAFDHQAPWWFYLPITLAMTFPVCYLFPWLIRFLASSDESIRSARTPAIGFFVLMSVWVIFFFSLSESKLPTYILPAVPFLGLMFGALVDYKISNCRETTSGLATEKLRWFSFERLPMVSAFGFVFIALSLIGALSVFWNSGLPIPGLWLVLVTSSALAGCFVSTRTRLPAVHWGMFGLAGILMMSTVSHFLIPHFADLRSTHLAIANLRRQPEFQSAPVVFLDRHSYSVSTVVSEREVFRFQANQKDLFQNFVATNPKLIIVAPAKMLSEYCQPLEPQINLEKHVFGKKYVHCCSSRFDSKVASEKNVELQRYGP